MSSSRSLPIPLPLVALCLGALVALAIAAFAEDAPAPAAPQSTSEAAAPAAGNVEAMRKLSFLVGEWDGNGWAVTPDGTRHEMRQHESVRTKLDGGALLVEGTGTEGGEVTFRAVGLIFYEPHTGLYKMYAGTNQGTSGPCTVTLVENGFDWFPDAAKGRVLYSMRLEDGWWHETGSYSTDGGTTWNPMMEMKLWKK